MHSLLAGWRLSLHRTRADWPIVMAAWLVTLLAAVLLSIGPIYSSAASAAGLHKALADAPSGSTDIRASVYADAKAATAMEGRVHAEMAGVLGSLGGSVIRDLRSSESFDLRGGSADSHDQAIIGSLDGLSDHAALVGGAWPSAGGGSAGALQVAVLDSVAKALDVGVGSDLSLVTTRFDETVTIPVRLVGVFRPNRVDDPYWRGDRLLTTGTDTDGSDRILGPFFALPQELLARPEVGSLHVQWAAFPDLARLTLDEVGPLRARLGALPSRLQAAVDGDVALETGLPSILSDVEQSLLVARASVLLLMLQLAILAAYAIVLTASLLVDHRRITTALLRSRGAGPLQVGLLSVAEGLLLAVPAVVLAPWAAVAALALLAVAGPLHDAGVVIAPRVTLDAYVAAGAAGLACVALLAVPALLAARGFAAEHREVSRQETRTFGQRMGLDIALLAVSGIALWQLRLYGAPLTRSVHGSLGLDPLLVAAPAIGLLAGGILALRVLPLLAQAVESAVSRGRNLVAPLGFRQLARRPLRYTRSALLLMIAMSTGAFAVSYAATWSGSQQDQAAFQAGADVRVRPFQGAVPQWLLPRAYASLADVQELAPVERSVNGIGVAGGSADLLAIDANTASRIVLLRPDAADQPLDALMAKLRAGQPKVPVITLPQGTAYLQITPRLDIGSITRMVFSPDSDQASEVPVDPAELATIRLSAIAFVRDAHGLIYRVAADELRSGASFAPVVLPLAPGSASGVPAGAQAQKGLDGPIQLAALAVDLWLPVDTIMSRGVVGIGAVSAGSAASGPWQTVSLASAGAWTAKKVQGDTMTAPADEQEGIGLALGAGDPEGRDVLFGNGPSVPPAEMTFMPGPLASLADAVPAIANRAFMTATGATVGGSVVANLDGASRSLTIVGVVDAFPTTDAAQPLVVLDERTLGMLRVQATSTAQPPDEWWLTVPPGQAQGLANTLRGAPYDSTEVVSVVERAHSLSTDPVALGIIAALTFGFVATGLFAVVGLTVSAAVSARQRRTEFALLRALGLSGRQLGAGLWLENGTLVIVSLVAGTLLGVFIAWLVLPFVTVTQQASAPVPPVLVDVPWPTVLLLDLASLVALAIAVLVIGIGLRRLGVGSILRMGED